MWLNAKNSTVDINGVPMSYAEFGQGQRPLVLLPGLGDGIKAAGADNSRHLFILRIFVNRYLCFSVTVFFVFF